MPTTSTLQAYRELEERVRGRDLDALLARWEFGRALLAERTAAGGRLPNGRLEELADYLDICRAEIKNRIQLAEEYPEEGLANAVSQYGSWHEIVRRGLGNRRPKPQSQLGGARRDEDDDAFRVPNRLRERLAAVTREAYAAGAGEGDNYLGYGVEALLDFVEGGGRDAWAAWLASGGARREAA